LKVLTFIPRGKVCPASTEAVFSVDRLRQFGEIGLCHARVVAMMDFAFLPAGPDLTGDTLAFQLFFSAPGFIIRMGRARSSPSR
jgi:hypothetical protein